MLRDPNEGLNYFKKFLRPHFIKGAQNVFLYRFMQFMKFNRGTMDLQKWMTRFLVFIKSNIKTQSQGSQETQDNSTTQAAMHSFERQVWMGAISIPSPSPCVNAQSDLKLDRKKITTHKWLREELNPPLPRNGNTVS